MFKWRSRERLTRSRSEMEDGTEGDLSRTRVGPPGMGRRKSLDYARMIEDDEQYL